MNLSDSILIPIPSKEECKGKNVYIFGKWYPLSDLYDKYGEGMVGIKIPLDNLGNNNKE